MKDQRQQAVWKKHADQWQWVGAPLRPTPEDGQLMLQLAQSALSGKSIAHVVVLGVTPEVVHLPWPAQAQLQAFDHSAEMIAKVWRPHAQVASSVQQVRWEAMPLPGRSVDLLVGDGSLAALPHLQTYRDVLTEVGRVIRPDGVLVVRCFIRPDQPETLETVAHAALSGQIRSFHALKWRVAMAQGLGEDFSVPVVGIRSAFNDIFPDRDHLARLTGWARETIDTIDVYAGTDTRYTFPTLAALRQACAPRFEVADVRHGHYELAERCPTICFRLQRA